MILLDTHTAIWMANDDDALGRASRAMTATARAERRLAVSPISFWEIALLTSRKWLELKQQPAALRNELLNTGVVELPLTGDVAILAAELNLHGDPADRFIVATAITHNATLVTADRALLRWRHKLSRQNAAK